MTSSQWDTFTGRSSEEEDEELSEESEDEDHVDNAPAVHKTRSALAGPPRPGSPPKRTRFEDEEGSDWDDVRSGVNQDGKSL